MAEKWTITDLKTFVGMEGCGGFNLALNLDGKEVARVIDSDDGGPHLFRWTDRDAEAKAESIVKAMPMRDIEGMLLSPDLDMWLDDLLNAHKQERIWRRACKTKTLFILKSDKPGDYREMKVVYSPEMGESLRAKHGENLVEIINERYL